MFTQVMRVFNVDKNIVLKSIIMIVGTLICGLVIAFFVSDAAKQKQALEQGFVQYEGIYDDVLLDALDMESEVLDEDYISDCLIEFPDVWIELLDMVVMSKQPLDISALELVELLEPLMSEEFYDEMKHTAKFLDNADEYFVEVGEDGVISDMQGIEKESRSLSTFEIKSNSSSVITLEYRYNGDWYPMEIKVRLDDSNKVKGLFY